VIGICTDSNSQLPPDLAERFGVEVVPLTVVIDDREYLEGVDLGVDDFYDLFHDGRHPRLRFNQPSPGQFAVAYDELVARGCTQILSIHGASACSGTLGAARLAVHSVAVPVRIVDSGTARFPVSCCVWAAGDAIAGGASLDEAAHIAETMSSSVGTVFVAAGPENLAGPIDDAGHCTVLALEPQGIRVVCDADSVADAVNAMAGYALNWGDASRGRRLDVGVGCAHRDMLPIADAVAHAVGESAHVADVVRFRIGPSVGAETGPSAVSCVMFPART
jgi:fatty acid-binding protein DegV